MQRFMKLTLLLICAILSSAVFANSDKEIEHLLDFVEHTECSYVRNGAKHNGPEARAHIQKKYDYYADDIKSAEDFIAYSASKSLISGSKYTIVCPDQEIQFSADWLLDELKQYRSLLKTNKK